MNAARVQAITVLLPIVALQLLTQGCSSSKPIPIGLKPVSLSPLEDKVDISIAFANSDNLEDFSFDYKSWGAGANSESVYIDKLLYESDGPRQGPYRYLCETSLQKASVGDVLRRNAEAVLMCVFNIGSSLSVQTEADVASSVADSQPNSELASRDINAIIKVMSPEVRFYVEFEKPPGAIDKPVLIAELTAEWVLEDLDGNEIWSCVVAGSGVYDYGIWDGFKKLIQRPFQPAVDDHFANLARVLVSAPEIRLYETCLQIDRGRLLSDPSSVHEILGGLQDPQKTRHIANKLVYLAVEEGNTDLLNQLLSTPLVDVSHEDKYYQKLPIHLAVQKDNFDAVRLLIAHQSPVDRTDTAGFRPLHSAAANGNRRITELLIQHGADVNARTADGETPFIMAARNDHQDEWQFLLDNGANPYAINEEDLLWTARLYKAIGMYYTERGRKSESAEALGIARDYYAQASSLYSRVSGKAKTDAFLKGLFEMTLLTVHAWGTQWQAEHRASQYAELRALNDASARGLSQTQTLDLIHDYKANALNSDVTLAVGTSPPPTPVSRRANSDSVAKYYSHLSEICQNASVEIKNILDCYEESGADFRECIPAESRKERD